MSTELPWTGLLLAGGRSRRMGRDKARLIWQGLPLIEHLHNLLRTAGASSVLVSGNYPQYQGIVDQRTDLGPLGGLISALPQCVDGLLLVLPVDMPRLSTELLCGLLDAAAANKAMALRYAPHPLPLLLRLDRNSRQCIIRRASAGAGDRSLRALFADLAGAEIDCPPPLREQLHNCNDPADWERALADETAS